MIARIKEPRMTRIRADSDLGRPPFKEQVHETHERHENQKINHLQISQMFTDWIGMRKSVEIREILAAAAAALRPREGFAFCPFSFLSKRSLYGICPSSPSLAPGARIHADRIAGGHRHHR